MSRMFQNSGLRLGLFFLLLFYISDSYAVDRYKNVNDSVNANKREVRVYNTKRLSTERPVIDGILNDACWETGDWSGNFTQWIPNEGAEPTCPTYINILYDDKNIYVAIRAIEHEPEKIVIKAGRRDQFGGDIVGVCFDSYHDYRTGFEFDVTTAGQKIDILLTNPGNADFNWNAVWAAKVGFEDSAWVAEFEIPLSQLRYSKDDDQIWGLHAWRWIGRLGEESDWEPQSSTGPGILYLFGEIHGIEDLPKSKRVEIMPYSLGKFSLFKAEEGNPYAENGRSLSGNAGIDAKIGITSNFTADITINPDFGQVESDPSVMNLTAFETLYEEKRPFFLEGKNIFDFSFDDVNLFYSRRIGAKPNYYPALDSNEFMKYTDNTSILSAVKVSGKNAKGFSIGMLQSLTATEHAEIDSLGNKSDMTIEPMTNYTITRLQQDFKEGNTMIGGIFTSTNRFINDDHLNYKNREAYTGGIDVLHHWNDKEFFVDAKFVGSLVQGSTDALLKIQKSSARYYQRSDIGHVNMDTNLTQLSGYGGAITVGKGSKGLWRYSTGANWRSPGLELNDLGFMHQADIFTQKNNLSYFVNKPVSIFRTYSISTTQNNNWDFDKRYLSSDFNLYISLEFLNRWSIRTSTIYTTELLDTRILWGGEAVLMPNSIYNSFVIGTDYSKNFYMSCNGGILSAGNKSNNSFSFGSSFTLIPISSLRISASGNYSNNTNKLQYVDTKEVNNNTVYLLGEINQETISMTFRMDYIITPELSLEYYGSPFVSTGRFLNFKTVADAKAGSFDDRFNDINPDLNGNSYEMPDFSFDNPDFNFSEFRSNFVFRWEYRPGSLLYLVWSHDRSSYAKSGLVPAGDALMDINDIYPNNIFLIKLNYWFSL